LVSTGRRTLPHSQRYNRSFAHCLRKSHINRNADVNWPPRSCDLIPLDYFLWGTIKDECYANQSETIEELKHEIKVAIDEIRAHTVENVLKNWVDRMGYCAASCGS